MSSSWVDPLLYCVASLFFLISVHMLWHLRWAKRLPARTSLNDKSLESVPLISVVLAARDEAARIEKTVRHLLAQQEITVEVIVVDDRSTDETGEILRRLAAEDARLKVIRVEMLPPEWLGKCHACHVGSLAATGEWILFTDADCWLERDVIIRALRTAARERADHITLTPGIEPESTGTAAWHLVFLLSLANWFSGVNRDRPNRFLGMGAFNFLRASAYRSCGGYEALRLTVVDDVKLGLLLRRSGFRTRGFIGGGDTLCHWGTTLGKMIRIMEKNCFAAIDYRLGVALAIGVVVPVCWGAALLGPLTGSVGGLLAGFSVLSLCIPAAAAARRLGWSMVPALFAPFVFPLLSYAVLNSTFVTLSRGGIRWRDTFYPLELLRKGNVQ